MGDADGPAVAKDEDVLAPSHEVALAIVRVSAVDDVSVGPPGGPRRADSGVPTGASTTPGCLTAPVIVTRRVPGPAGVPRLRDHTSLRTPRALVPAHTSGKERPGYDPLARVMYHTISLLPSSCLLGSGREGRGRGGRDRPIRPGRARPALL